MKYESSIFNYYDILNVKPTASVDEIKKKFKQKTLETHPDKNKNAQSNFKMQELNEAKRILTNKKLRKIYDQKLEWQPFLGLIFGRHLFFILNLELSSLECCEFLCCYINWYNRFLA